MGSCYYDNKEDLYQYYELSCDTTAISYQTDILPIIQSQCVSCHTSANPDGGVALETFADVQFYGANGSLHGSVIGDGYAIMPPSGVMVTCNIDKIEAWVRAGMPNN